MLFRSATITAGYAAQQLVMLVHQSVDELGQGGVKSKNTAMHSPLTRVRSYVLCTLSCYIAVSGDATLFIINEPADII